MGNISLIYVLNLFKHHQSCPKIFTQVYILLTEYKKTSVLCAISLLPDKKRISYFVFILLLLLEFKRRFGIEKLGLQKLKMDYELGKIDYFLDNS